MVLFFFFLYWCSLFFVCFVFFFFKQKTAYEMRISDWSSDVCSSDLCGRARFGEGRLSRLQPPLPLPRRSSTDKMAAYRPRAGWKKYGRRSEMGHLRSISEIGRAHV